MYTERWAVDAPGCLIFLIDESPAMQRSMGAGLIGARGRVAEAVAMTVNNMLCELQRRCEWGGTIRHRIDVAVLGYGVNGTVRNALESQALRTVLIPIDRLAAHPRLVRRVSVSEYNPDMGTIDEVQRDVPVWVQAEAGTGAPLCAALDVAYDVAQHWVASHPESLPPVVANITSGSMTDGDPYPYARRLRQLSTKDGNALLFNCMVISEPGFVSRYPSCVEQVPPLTVARQLFDMSSEIPQSMIAMGNSMGVPVQPGARGFVFGADIDDMPKFITIADRSS